MSSREEYESLSLNESINYSESKHASHCLIYALDSNNTYYALVQLRFDGLIGFAGGEVDDCSVTVNAIIDATNRELREEVNYSYDCVTSDEWICTHRLVRNSSDWVQHFFAKQLTSDQFRELEKNHLYAQHFPSESLGVFRVPIGEKGKNSSPIATHFLPNFLRQKFSGNARQQFVEAILKLDLLCPDDHQLVEASLNDENNTSCGEIRNDSTLKRCLLFSRFDVNDYHDETVSAIYGLMIIRSDGLFDLIEISDNNNRNHLISDDICIDHKTQQIILSSSHESNELIATHITSDQFCSIESHFTCAQNFVRNSVFGIFRIPLSFNGQTDKANNYLHRFLNGILKQQFCHNSKQLLIDMLLNGNNDHNISVDQKVIEFIKTKITEL